MYVFNLSYHRNATTSFHDFMQKHKINSIHNVSAVLEKIIGMSNNILIPEDWLENSLTADEFVDLYSGKIIEYIKNSNIEAFSDNPFPLIYKELVAEFPDAKFVLFKRNENDWLDSVKNYFGDKWTYFRRILYDSNKKEDYWTLKYNNHNNSVIEYFKNCGIDLLVIDLNTNPDISKELINFLNIENKKHDDEELIFPTLNCNNVRQKAILEEKKKKI